MKTEKEGSYHEFYKEAIQIFTSLDFYASHYSSSKPFWDRHDEIIDLLRKKGEKQGRKSFLLLADLLSEYADNRPYEPRM